jgi:hypothetical protein
VSRQRPSAQLTRRVRATQLTAGGSVPPPPPPAPTVTLLRRHRQARGVRRDGPQARGRRGGRAGASRSVGQLLEAEAGRGLPPLREGARPFPSFRAAVFLTEIRLCDACPYMTGWQRPVADWASGRRGRHHDGCERRPRPLHGRDGGQAALPAVLPRHQRRGLRCRGREADNAVAPPPN